jgi:hypothetical protein
MRIACLLRHSRLPGLHRGPWPHRGSTANHTVIHASEASTHASESDPPGTRGRNAQRAALNPQATLGTQAVPVPGMERLDCRH